MKSLRWTLILVLITLACNLSDYEEDSGGEPTAPPATAEEAAATEQPQAVETPAPPTDTPVPPTDTPIAEPTPVPTEVVAERQHFSYQGIDLAYDPAICESIGGLQAESYQFINGDTVPAHIQLALSGYALADTFHQPVIYIYPAPELAANSEYMADIITGLQNIIAGRPADISPGPRLPLVPAAELLRAQVSYVDFQNGSGVRYLTQLGQAYWPANNRDLFYTFQGLTTDGAYYVAAVLPVGHPLLPDDGSEFEDLDSLYEDPAPYRMEIEAFLNGEAADSFIPALNLLDEMMSSLVVNSGG